MQIFLYIIFVCYVPIISVVIPSFGEGINSAWIVFYILVLVFIIQQAVTKNFRLGGAWILLLIAFTFVVFASITWSNHHSYNLYNFQRLLARNLAPLIIAIIAVSLFENPKSVDQYMRHIIIAALILSIISIYQMIFVGFMTDELFRSAATMRNPNALAVFLVLTIPCILYAFENKLIPQKILLPIGLTVVGGIICTVSRKGIATMILCCLVYMFLKKKFKMLIITSIVFAVIGVFISGYAVITHRFESDTLKATFAGKMSFVFVGLKMFADHPIIGHGYMGFYDNLNKYFPEFHKDHFDAHNIYITTLVNNGFFGFIPFIGVFIFPIILSIKALRIRKKGKNIQHRKDMAIICITSILPFMISGWFAGGLMCRYDILFALYSQIAFFICVNSNYMGPKPGDYLQSFFKKGV